MDIRHPTITWANVAPDICRRMVSLDPNELQFLMDSGEIFIRSIQGCFTGNEADFYEYLSDVAQTDMGH